MKDKVSTTEFSSASLKRSASDLATTQVHGLYQVKCFDKDGNLKWEDSFPNLVTTAGKNYLLDTGLDGGTAVTTWYLGLKNTGSAVAGDTLASHGSWTEFSSYTGNRKAVAFAAASGGSSAGTEVTFAITGSGTVYGCFLASADTGTSGTLYSAGDFGASKAVDYTDTLAVTYSSSLT